MRKKPRKRKEIKEMSEKEYEEVMENAIADLKAALFGISMETGLCALCLAHAFADYVDALEERGIAKHRGQVIEDNDIKGGTVH